MKQNIRVSEQPIQSNLPFDLNSRPDWFGAALAVTLQVAAVTIIIVVLQVEIYLDTWNDEGNSIHLIATTGTAVAATFATSVTLSAVRKLWFRCVITSRASSQRYNAVRQRVITGLGSFKDQISTWDISLAFVFVSLVTAAIVAVLTPRTVVVVSPSRGGRILSDPGAYCINNVSSGSTAGQWFTWKLDDGSVLGVDQNLTQQGRSACSSRDAIDFLTSGLPEGMPRDAAYVVGDSLVLQDAIGSPAGAYGFDEIFGTVSNTTFQWSTGCFPVLIKNPVRCKAIGSVNATASSITVTDGECTISNDGLRIDPSRNDAAVSGACTQGQPIGKATIVIGALGGLDEGYATRLAELLGQQGNGIDGEFSASCSIDIEAAVGLRMLNYSLSDRAGQTGYSSSSLQHSSSLTMRSGFAYQIARLSNESCSMVDDSGLLISMTQILSPAVLANAAGATWPLLAENMNDDGWFDTLDYIAGQTLSYHFTTSADTSDDPIFPNSSNQLEDALGAVTALAMGIFWSGTGSVNYSSLAPSSNAYTRIRLGPANNLGYLYLLPSTFSIGLLGWLTWRAYKEL